MASVLRSGAPLVALNILGGAPLLTLLVLLLGFKLKAHAAALVVAATIFRMPAYLVLL